MKDPTLSFSGYLDPQTALKPPSHRPQTKMPKQPPLAVLPPQLLALSEGRLLLGARGLPEALRPERKEKEHIYIYICIYIYIIVQIYVYTYKYIYIYIYTYIYIYICMCKYMCIHTNIYIYIYIYIYVHII